LASIAIIGCGSLGRRHLQSLLDLDDTYELYGVDPTPASLAATSELLPTGKTNVKLLTSLEDLPRQLDFIVVATNSRERFAVLNWLANHVSTKCIILEKVLFPNLDDYQKALAFTQGLSTKIYVNCPRRSWDYYRDVKRLLQDQRPGSLEYRVEALDWGLCCNTIHFIDLGMWLFESQVAVVNTSGLSSKIVPAKRPGYFEINGVLKIAFKNGSSLYLESFVSDSTRKKVHTIVGETVRLNLNETDGIFTISNGKSLEQEAIVSVPSPLQSKATLKHFREFESSSTISLPTLKQSCSAHIPLIAALGSHFKAHLPGVVETCPIT
jgi:predicted dehydrogenase